MVKLQYFHLSLIQPERLHFLLYLADNDPCYGV